MGEGNFENNLTDKKMQKFSEFFKLYQAELGEQNLIDYDDKTTIIFHHAAVVDGKHGFRRVGYGRRKE